MTAERQQSGYIALMAVLVLGAAALTISLALLTTGMDSQRAALIRQQSVQAQALARYCGEEALQQIHDNIAFSTTASGTTVNDGQGSCNYVVNAVTPTTRSIRAQGMVGDVTRKIQALATVGSTTIAATSWTDEDDNYMGINFLQSSNTYTNDTGSTTAPVTFRGPVTAGSLIVLAFTWDSSSGTGTLTCSDSMGDTFTTVNIWNDTSNTQALGICYAPNSNGGAGTPTVTPTLSASKGFRRVAAAEYSGVAASNPVDVSAGVGGVAGTTTANSITSGNVTTTANGDLIFGAVMDTGTAAPIAPGTGFTQRNFTNLKDLAIQDFVQQTAGTTASTQTFGTANRYNAAVVAFKAALK